MNKLLVQQSCRSYSFMVIYSFTCEGITLIFSVVFMENCFKVLSSIYHSTIKHLLNIPYEWRNIPFIFK